MKKLGVLFTVCLFILLPSGKALAQDMATAVEIYNAGGAALNENNYPVALESFSKALAMLEEISSEERGEEWQTIMTGIKAVVPHIHLRYAKELYNAKDYDNAMTQLQKASDTGEKYEVLDAEMEALGLIPTFLKGEATTLLNDGKNEEAIVVFKKLLEIQPNSGEIYYYVGVAETRLNNEEGAIASFEKAIEQGEANSKRQLANIYLRRAANAQTARNWQEIFDNAVKSNEYEETAAKMKMAGNAAHQLKKYNDAVKYLEMYLATLETSATDREDIIYMIADAYENSNNSAKACGYYKQLLNSAKYKDNAAYKVNTVLKCG